MLVIGYEEIYERCLDVLEATSYSVCTHDMYLLDIWLHGKWGNLQELGWVGGGGAGNRFSNLPPARHLWQHAHPFPWVCPITIIMHAARSPDLHHVRLLWGPQVLEFEASMQLGGSIRVHMGHAWPVLAEFGASFDIACICTACCAQTDMDCG